MLLNANISVFPLENGKSVSVVVQSQMDGMSSIPERAEEKMLLLLIRSLRSLIDGLLLWLDSYPYLLIHPLRAGSIKSSTY